MKKRKTISQRLLALTLCLLCLLAAMPIAALADDGTEPTAITETVELPPESSEASEPASEPSESGEPSEPSGEPTVDGTETVTEPSDPGHNGDCVDGCTVEGCPCACHLTPTDPPAETEETQETEPASLSFYDRLLACESCQEMYFLLAVEPVENVEALTYDQLTNLLAYVDTLPIDNDTEDLIFDLVTLRDGDVSTLDPWDGNNNNKNATVGHIEFGQEGKATIVIDGKEYSQTVNFTMSDVSDTTFSITATQNGSPYTNFTVNKNKIADDSMSHDGKSYATVRVYGSYPVGTKDNPIKYTVSITKKVTFNIPGLDPITDDVTMTYTVGYWDDANWCPGKNGDDVGRNAGIDAALGGVVDSTVVTKGRFGIKKIVNGETGTEFQFYVQNGEGMYLKFSDNKYTGTSDTRTDDCIITVKAGNTVTLEDVPTGTYRVTEIQRDGYVIADAEGSNGNGYTKDFVIENKSDTEIPIATFTNKKLTTEAGISIAKVSTGLTNQSLATVNIAIYRQSDCTNGVPNEGATAVWSGAVAVNGDRLYLTASFAAGSYVVVETGADIEGYNCSTTLTGNATINGMTFTVAAGNRYDLTVTNAYTEKPNSYNLTVTKLVSGNMYNANDKFTFTVTYGDTTDTFTLGNNDFSTVSIPVGATVTVTETDSKDYDYALESVTGVAEDAYTKNDKGISFTMPENDVDVVIKNTKDITISTGVLLDTLPYVLILAVVAVGAVVMVRKRRDRDED